LTDFNAAIKLDASANNVRSYNGRGQARLSLNDFKGAIEDFNMVLKNEPKNLNALRNRTIAKLNSGDKKGACEDYAKGLSLGDSRDAEIDRECR